ncbi:MAG TPA: response regulator [Saprospiraceae bacterium]|nr:response regulator [Saprospiraceae bacterium]HND89639.1 response regulator [Saprospiraceae bacterium]
MRNSNHYKGETRSPLRRALILEGNDPLRLFISSFLAAEFEVVSASTGVEAMAKLSRGFIPDIIITHAKTAETSGADFLSNLRTSGLFGSIPVVAIGEDDLASQEHCRGLGVKEYFCKPFNPIQFHDRIIQIVG